LLGFELAELYKRWSKRIPNSDLPRAELETYRLWQDALTDESAIAISRARSGSELLRALGGGSPRPRPSEAAKPADVAAKQTPSPDNLEPDPMVQR
jgi:hypothetical protein